VPITKVTNFRPKSFTGNHSSFFSLTYLHILFPFLSKKWSILILEKRSKKWRGLFRGCSTIHEMWLLLLLGLLSASVSGDKRRTFAPCPTQFSTPGMYLSCQTKYFPHFRCTHIFVRFYNNYVCVKVCEKFILPKIIVQILVCLIWSII
jgi:hypothetical protein